MIENRKPTFDAKAIAEECKTRDWVEVMEEFGCSRATVSNACQLYGVPMVGKNMLKARLVKKFIEDNPGCGIADVAAATGVTQQTIYRYCDTYGFEPPVKRPKTVARSTFEILKQMIDGHRDVDIAQEFFVSRQRVNQIRVEAERAGILEKSEANNG